MLTNIIYILVFVILVFVLSIAVKAITRGVEAKQIIKDEKNSESNLETNSDYKNLEVICLEPGEAKTEMNKGSKDNTNKILKVIILLINSKKNLNGLFINRELTSLTYLNTKKISIHD